MTKQKVKRQQAQKVCRLWQSTSIFQVKEGHKLYPVNLEISFFPSVKNLWDDTGKSFAENILV